MNSGMDVNGLVRNAKAADLAKAITVAHKKAGVVLEPPVNGNTLRFVNPGCFSKTGELTTKGFEAFDKVNSDKSLGIGVTINSTMQDYIAALEKTIKKCLKNDEGVLYRKFHYFI